MGDILSLCYNRNTNDGTKHDGNRGGYDMKRVVTYGGDLYKTVIPFSATGRDRMFWSMTAGMVSNRI